MTTIPLVIACAVVGLGVGPLLNVLIARELKPEGLAAASGARQRHSTAVRSTTKGRALGDPRLRLNSRIRIGSAATRNTRDRVFVTGTGVLFAVTAAYFGPVWHLPAYLYLAAAGVALALIDLHAHRLPNSIVLPSYLIGGAGLAAASLINGDPTAVLRAAAGGTGMLAGYATMALLQPHGMGGGDVKLAGVLGMYLAWLGWPQLLIGWLAALALAATVAVGLLVTRRASRASTIAFGPFMLIGAVAGVAIGGWIGA